MNSPTARKRSRQINIEALRIIAMLMVLGLHANFVSLKQPSAENILTMEGLSRTFLEFLCIVAVNVFVMISGWFKIRPKMHGFCKFMWQVIYIVGILWIVGVYFFNVPANYKTILTVLGLYGGGGWFVSSYNLLSPVLNAFLENSSVKTVKCTLIAFFIFEFFWGNTWSVKFIDNGYSSFSFIGIYLLAGLLRKMNLRYEAKCYLGVFIMSVIVNVCIYVWTVLLGIMAIQSITMYYINPLIIIGASSLLLFFHKIHFPITDKLLNRGITWIASSCFAAYLLHTGMEYIFKLYCEGVRCIYDTVNGIESFLCIILYILLVFLTAVFIDNPRKIIWNRAFSPLFNKSCLSRA